MTSGGKSSALSDVLNGHDPGPLFRGLLNHHHASAIFRLPSMPIANSIISTSSNGIPILLLKSPSPSPEKDVYTAHLSPTFAPHFVPVLTHTLLPDPIIKLLLHHLPPTTQDTPNKQFPYGALILTSQRAVAALNSALSSPPIQNHNGQNTLKDLTFRFYTVGPATAKALREIRDRWLPKCEIHGGEDAGNGEVLARLILGEGQASAKYAAELDDSVATAAAAAEEEREGGQTSSASRKKPILFLTGETRRDILPRMLQSPNLPDSARIRVDEMVVYRSDELEDFEFSFTRTLAQTEEMRGLPTAGVAGVPGIMWIVVFSPTAGKGMLKGLGWLDEGSGKVRSEALEGRRVFVCCIGPTTRGYLEGEFGFMADVVAKVPSPEGVREGIKAFMEGLTNGDIHKETNGRSGG